MINLKDYEEVKILQTNIRATFESPAGKESLKFLEQICGWFDFSETDPNAILISHGKRQVLATIKTLLDLNAEEVVTVAREQEQ